MPNICLPIISPKTMSTIEDVIRIEVPIVNSMDIPLIFQKGLVSFFLYALFMPYINDSTLDEELHTVASMPREINAIFLVLKIFVITSRISQYTLRGRK